MLESKKVLTLLALGLALLGTGCHEGECIDANSPEASKAPADTKGRVAVVNARCPVVNRDAIPGNMAKENCVVEWRGQKVGLCCPGCAPNWAKMTDAEKDAALARATQ
jgi:hypothetical protein